MNYKKQRLLFLIFFLSVANVWAEFKVPALRGRVVDDAHVLSSDAVRLVQEASEKIEAKTGAQVAFLSVPSLEDEDIAQASIRVTDAWKLGSASKDNGVLFLMAKAERKMRIEVGQGLEGEITDLRAKRIIDQTVRPQFKRGDFDQGVVSGIYAIAYAIDPSVDWAKECPECRFGSSKSTLPPSVLFIFIVIAVVFFLIASSQSSQSNSAYDQNGRRRSNYWGPGGGGPWLGGGGGFGGGSGGGGGFSGGGGGFSGGGASGDW